MFFFPRKVFELNEEIDNRLLKESKAYDGCVSYLTGYYKIAMKVLRRIHADIVREVERESGWRYTAHSFEYRGKFLYDPTTEDIDFSVDRVHNTSGKYVGEDYFSSIIFQKCGKLLDRLARIEGCMDRIYESNKDKVDRAVKEFEARELGRELAARRRGEEINRRREEEIRTREEEAIRMRRKGAPLPLEEESKRIEEKHMLESREERKNEKIEDELAKYFMRRYGDAGLLELVRLLNVASDAKEPMLAYNSLRMKAQTSMGKESNDERLLVGENIMRSDYVGWMAAYLSNGQILLEEFEKERESGRAQMEAPLIPPIDEVRTQLVAYYHL